MNNIDLKKSSLFLLFKDCVNQTKNTFNNSLFAKIWSDHIDDEHLRKNREDAYTIEYIQTWSKHIRDFLDLSDKQVYTEKEIKDAYNAWIAEMTVSKGICQYTDLSLEDKIRITRGYLDLSSRDYAIVVLYYPVVNDWQYIKGRITSCGYNIVSDFILDFSNNLIGFKNLIMDIYCDYDSSSDSLIQRKINLLIKSRMIVNIVVLNNDSSKHFFYKELGRLKLELRDILTYTSEKDAFLNIHTPENREESEYLKCVVVSVNNLWYIKNRLVHQDKDVFLNKIKTAQNSLNQAAIPVAQTCICGTGSMDAVGIWRCNDIDVLSLQPFCGLEGIDYFDKEYNRVSSSKTKLFNRTIITDDNYYFFVAGMKFANLSIIRDRNIYSFRLESSRKKIRAIDTFYSFLEYVDDKEVLNKEIQIEFERRRKELKNNVSLPRRIARKIRSILKGKV